MRSDEWQPIETAPRDGTRVLLLLPMPLQEPPYVLIGGVATITTKQAPYERDAWTDDGGAEIAPSHWQPLPAPPGAGDEGACADCGEHVRDCDCPGGALRAKGSP